MRPRLSAVLVVVNLAVILLPLGSIFFFRIYENQLIQETERELISQAAMIAAAYSSAVPASVGRPPVTRPAGVSSKGGTAGRGVQILETMSGAGMLWTPVAPELDLARVDTLPARPDGQPPAEPPSALAFAAGSALSPVLEEAQRTTLIGARILDLNGTVVGGTAEIGLNFGHVEEVRAALGGRYASALRAREVRNAPSELVTISRGTGVRVFIAFPILKKGLVLGAVYLSRTPKSILRHLYEERDKAILSLLTVLLLSASLAVLTSRTISRPVATLLERTRRVTSGETATMPPLERPGTREISELSEGISQMATALGERAAYIRTLANHVSHEFKTPLASIRGAVELLQDHHETMTEDERARFLANISGSSDRLHILLDRLLELARAENAMPTDKRIELAPVIRAAVKDRMDGIRITTHVADDAAAFITAEALEIVIANLIDNAVSHGATEVVIDCRTIRGVRVTVADNGAGITMSNRERIFEPFFTTRRESGGTGLGLGIVRALLTAHGGSISLSDHKLGGAAFLITLRE
ncbi:MAG: ATP-binding protein [Pseudomonadota bacterium]